MQATAASMRLKETPTKASEARRAAAAEASPKPLTKKGFGSSASRGLPSEIPAAPLSDMASEPMSGREVQLINRLVPHSEPVHLFAGGNGHGVGGSSPPEAKYSSAKRGFGSSSSARKTEAWLAAPGSPGRTKSGDASDAQVEDQSYMTDDFYSTDGYSYLGQEEDWGQREGEEALDSEEEAEKVAWSEAAEAEAILAAAEQAEQMAELHAVQKRLIQEIEADPDNLSLLQHLSQVDRAMALAVNAGAAPPMGRSPPPVTKQSKPTDAKGSKKLSLNYSNGPESPSRVERARRSAANQDREDARVRANQQRKQRELDLLERARQDAERNVERQRRASSPMVRISRLLRPKTATDSASAAERRQKRIVQAQEQAQKDLTFQPSVPKAPPPRPQDVRPVSATRSARRRGSLSPEAAAAAAVTKRSPGSKEKKPHRSPKQSSLTSTPEAGEAGMKSQLEPGPEPEPELQVSDRLYRESVRRAERDKAREEQLAALELSSCTFSPSLSATSHHHAAAHWRKRQLAAASKLAAAASPRPQQSELQGKDSVAAAVAAAVAATTSDSCRGMQTHPRKQPAEAEGESPEEDEAVDVISRSRVWQAERDAKLADRRAALLKQQAEQEELLYKPFKAKPAPPSNWREQATQPTAQAVAATLRAKSPASGTFGAPPTPPVSSLRAGGKKDRLAPKVKYHQSGRPPQKGIGKFAASTENENGSPTAAAQRKAAAKLSGQDPAQPTLRHRRFLAEAAVTADTRLTDQPQTLQSESLAVHVCCRRPLRYRRVHR